MCRMTGGMLLLKQIVSWSVSIASDRNALVKSNGKTALMMTENAEVADTLCKEGCPTQ